MFMYNISKMLIVPNQSKMNRVPKRGQSKQTLHWDNPHSCKHPDSKSPRKNDQKFHLPVVQDTGYNSLRKEIKRGPKLLKCLDISKSDILALINQNIQRQDCIKKSAKIAQGKQGYHNSQCSVNLFKQKQTMLRKIAMKHYEHEQKRKQFVFLLKDQSSQIKRQRRLNIGKGQQNQNQLVSTSQLKLYSNNLKPTENVLKPSSKQQGSRRHQVSLSSQGFVLVKQITTKMKPPQRYKTSMVYCKGGQLFLYGGLGCQKNISWSQLDIKTKQWDFPNQAHKTLASTMQQIQYSKSKPMTNPLFGHTMNFCKGMAYVFGGTTSDTVYDLTIINVKEKIISSGPKAPFRRRQHASVLMGGKYLIIHGGIQTANGQPKREMFYYNTQSGKWDFFNNANAYHYPGQSRELLPALSHHGMVCTDVRTKKKIRKVSDLCLGTIYIFGGRTEDGSCSNKLYKVKIKDQNDVVVQQVAYDANAYAPEPRHMCCFEYIGNGFLLLYGGKSTDEQNGFYKRNGVFNDLLIFNTDTDSWLRPQLSQKLEYRFGMSSAVSLSNGLPNGKVYIFGGCDLKAYCNANVLVLNISETQQQMCNSIKSINPKSFQEEEEQGTKNCI